MNSRAWPSLLAALAVCFTANQAAAHIQLTCPVARYAYSASGIKMGPCGAPTGKKSNMVTHLVAGQQLLVTFTETIYHPGFFRISLDPTGADTFPAISPTPENPVMSPVLADNILPHTSAVPGGKRMFVVTIPSTPCAKCTLQLTQFMMDNPTSGYYECADVVVDAVGTPFSCGPTGAGGASGGGGARGAGGTSGAGGGGVGTAGSTGIGGTPGSGGASPNGTGGSTPTGSGGTDASGSGGASSGGANGSGGASSGGANGSGGASSGGATGSGGASSGGTNGSGGAGSGGAASGGAGSGESSDGSSGGCAYLEGDASLASTLAALVMLALAFAGGRRRRSSPR
jgi:hypothetical protein